MNKSTLPEHLYVELILSDVKSFRSLRTVAESGGVGNKYTEKPPVLLICSKKKKNMKLEMRANV